MKFATKKDLVKPLILILSFFIQFHNHSLRAQKQFRVTVNLPQLVDAKRVEVWIDNGKEVKQIKPVFAGTRQLVFTGDYFSLYPALILQNSLEEKEVFFVATFFIEEGPASITFAGNGSSQKWYKDYKLKNVLDFKEEQKHMYEYTDVERKRATEYESKYGDKLFAGNDTAVKNLYFKGLRPAFERRKLQYVIQHPESYFSFYSFRSDLAKPNITTWDSLLLVFNMFPDKFRYSDEGNYLNAFLYGRLSIQNRIAVDFNAKDIYNEPVSLGQFRGEKYVLLHFWATWCSPCIRELPALKEIIDQINPKDLHIISIALPSAKYKDFLNTIDKFQMNWVQIYNDSDLVNMYGNAGAPRLCLVDKKGNLIYDKVGLGKNEDFQLLDLKKILKELITE